jgi:uncharacterized protein YjgD (DUF1641 family)
MYFPAFGENQRSPLSEDLTYIVEALVSEMLANADVWTLKRMLQEPRIVEMLLNELEFLGQISRADLPRVRDYLIKEESNLFESIKCLAQNPDSEEIRQELCTARAASPNKR